MKKFYCFYCQKEVTPRRLLKWRFCPDCRHYITDKGEGFYRICDYCGANMPVEATRCLKCNHSTGLVQEMPLNNTPVWLEWLFRIGLIVLSLFLAVGILYVSFYLIFAVFVLGLAFYLFNLFLPRR